jgi:uncharacterized membrane protein YvbJ
MSENNSHTDKEIQNLAPTLFSLKKENMAAPEGYFEGMGDEVMEKIHGSHTTEQEPIKKKSRLVWAIAASLVILLGITALMQQSAVEPIQITEEFEPDLTEDEDYLLAFDESLIIDAYLDEMDELDNIQEAYIDYLMEDELELDDLISEI